MYKYCAKEKQKPWLTKKTKKWKRDKWKSINIEMKRWQYRKLMKNRSERRKHCALAVVRLSQKKSPRCRPPSRGRRAAKI